MENAPEVKGRKCRITRTIAEKLAGKLAGKYETQYRRITGTLKKDSKQGQQRKIVIEGKETKL